MPKRAKKSLLNPTNSNINSAKKEVETIQQTYFIKFMIENLTREIGEGMRRNRESHKGLWSREGQWYRIGLWSRKRRNHRTALMNRVRI